MGDILSRIAEDWQDYKELCEEVGEEVKSIGEKPSFYDHAEEIMKKYGWRKTYWGYEKNPPEFKRGKDTKKALNLGINRSRK